MAKTGQHRVEPYMGRLFGYAVSLLRDREPARELVQDCVMKALAARTAPANEAAYRAWLFTILRNTAIDRLRQAALATVSLDDEPEMAERAGWQVEESLINRLTVRTAMARLCQAHREIVALIDIAGFTYGEAAALLDIPRGTVMSRISRARRALLSVISEDNVHSLPSDRRRRRA